VRDVPSRPRLAPASHGRVIAVDAFVDFGGGFEVNRWPGGVTREVVVERLRQLLDKPFAFVLAIDGGPTTAPPWNRPGLTTCLCPPREGGVIERLHLVR
jgi:hypothetical protein